MMQPLPAQALAGSSNRGSGKGREREKSEGRVIVCTNVLPVIIQYDEYNGKWHATFDRESLFEDGPMYAGLRGAVDREVIFVGNPNVFVPPGDRNEVEELLWDMKCLPIFCDVTTAHRHFQGFCKAVLWPMMHNIIDLYSFSSDPECGEDHDETEPVGGQSSTLGDDVIDRESSSTPSRGASMTRSQVNASTWVPPRSWTPLEGEKCWRDYAKMNQMFAYRIVEIFRTDDMIWIHDYHLCLLPSFVRHKLPASAVIGLFLHIPFPSSEIFRILGEREEMINAMLCADHLGFHLFEYARHFITACSRMVGCSSFAQKGGSIGIRSETGRVVTVTCSHGGLKHDWIVECLNSMPSNQALVPSAENDVKLIVGLDEIEGLRGLALKLYAFEELLKSYSSVRGKVKLKQVGLRLDSRPDDYHRTSTEVQRLVNKINKKWGPVVEYYEVDGLSLRERLELFRSGDIMLTTPARSGLDAMPFEYMIARGHGEESAGVLILSELTGASRVLNGAFRVNPFHFEAVAEAIYSALNMSQAEREARRARNLAFVERTSLESWAKRVLSDMKAAGKQQDNAFAMFGLGFALQTFSENSKKAVLDSFMLCRNFNLCNRRLIVLDYADTIVETDNMDKYMKSSGSAREWHYAESGPGRRPGGCLETRHPLSKEMRDTLEKLTSDPRNTVAVVTADLREEVDRATQGIRNLALIAEDGYVVRLKPGDPWHPVLDDSGDGDWYGGSENFVDHDPSSGAPDAMNVDQGEFVEPWKNKSSNIMIAYRDRTNGAFVWQAPSAISFNYVLADPELGQMQAKNLMLELEQSLSGLPVRVINGRGFVTVQLKGVNRGQAVLELRAMLDAQAEKSQDGSDKGKVDFVFYAGDGTEDEAAFSAVEAMEVPETRSHGSSPSSDGENGGKQKQEQKQKQVRSEQDDDIIHKITCKVGSSDKTAASYWVHDEAEFEDVLQRLVAGCGRHMSILRSQSHGDGLEFNTNSKNHRSQQRSPSFKAEIAEGTGFMTKQTWRRSQMQLSEHESNNNGAGESGMSLQTYNTGWGKGREGESGEEREGMNLLNPNSHPSMESLGMPQSAQPSFVSLEDLPEEDDVNDFPIFGSVDDGENDDDNEDAKEEEEEEWDREGIANRTQPFDSPTRSKKLIPSDQDHPHFDSEANASQPEQSASSIGHNQQQPSYQQQTRGSALSLMGGSRKNGSTNKVHFAGNEPANANANANANASPSENANANAITNASPSENANTNASMNSGKDSEDPANSSVHKNSLNDKTVASQQGSDAPSSSTSNENAHSHSSLSSDLSSYALLAGLGASAMYFIGRAMR